MSNDEFVMNPHTSRPIKAGGRLYRNLVASGLIEQVQEHEESKVLSEDPGDIPKLNRQLSTTKQAVKGRGRFAGKAVVRNMPRNWMAAEKKPLLSESEESEEEGDSEEEDKNIMYV